MFSARSFSVSISGSLNGISDGWIPSWAMYTSAGDSGRPSRVPSSQTGAPLLYGRAGMAVRTSYLRYRKELRPGRDPATLASDE